MSHGRYRTAIAALALSALALAPAAAESAPRPVDAATTGVNSELRQTVLDLAAAAGELRTTAGELAERADPLIASLTRTAEAAGPAAIETLTAARAVIAGPELREALANLTAMSAELRDLPARLEARSGPLLTSAVAGTDQAGQAAADARRTIAALDATFGSRSTFQSDLQTLLREVTGATRSLRQVLDLLQRVGLRSAGSMKRLRYG